MQKRNALYKAAVDTRVLGTAFGGAIGAIPGLIDLFNKNKKDQRSKSVGKLLLGIGAGATIGNVGGSIYQHRPLTNSNFYDIYLSNVNKGKPYKSIFLAAGIGAIPGLMDLNNLHKIRDEKERQKAKTQIYKKLTKGVSIGGSLASFNSVYNRTFNLLH